MPSVKKQLHYRRYDTIKKEDAAYLAAGEQPPDREPIYKNVLPKTGLYPRIEGADERRSLRSNAQVQVSLRPFIKTMLME